MSSQEIQEESLHAVGAHQPDEEATPTVAV